MPNDRDPEDRDHNQDPSKMPQDRGWCDREANPFVAFRRFADEQVSSLLQSITGLPSAVSPPQSDRWMIFTGDEGYKSMVYRQRSGDNNAVERSYTSDPSAESSSPGDRDETPTNNGGTPVSRSSQTRRPEQDDRWQSPPRRDQHSRVSDFFGLDSFFDRFEDHLLPFSLTLFHPRNNFSLFDTLEDSGSPTWPMTYIMFSPYSPLHLERQAYYSAHQERGIFSSLMPSFRLDSERDPAEPQWREAFEDLLRLENGKPMLDREASTADKAETGNDWLYGMVKRGSLGDRWKYMPGTADHPWSGITFDGCCDENMTESELEFYKRELEDLKARNRESLRLARLERQHDECDQNRSGMSHADDQQSNEDTETWLDLVSGGNHKSVPETPVGVTSMVEVKPKEGDAPRVISTMSHTERRRLADGSMQIKTIKTRRFTDGREETDESVEVTHPQPGDGKSSEGGKSSSGWFWKD